MNMQKCSQCNNNAIYIVEKHLMCLSCYERHMNICMRAINENEKIFNLLSDQIDSAFGLGIGPRFPITQPAISTGPTTHNYIHIDKSVVGTVNTGAISQLNQTMENINNSNPDLVKQISEFVNEFLSSGEFSNKIKQELLESTSFILEEIKAPKTNRKKILEESVLLSIERAINSSASLIALWHALLPHIQAILK